MESKGVGPKSIRNYVGTLSAMFTFAMAPRRRWATVNPCGGLELPAAEASTEIRFLELDEVDALVAGVRPATTRTSTGRSTSPPP